jgi:hypothetical protein
MIRIFVYFLAYVSAPTRGTIVEKITVLRALRTDSNAVELQNCLAKHKESPKL